MFWRTSADDGGVEDWGPGTTKHPRTRAPYCFSMVVQYAAVQLIRGQQTMDASHTDQHKLYDDLNNLGGVCLSALSDP
jgi:hypothetical protein